MSKNFFRNMFASTLATSRSNASIVINVSHTRDRTRHTWPQRNAKARFGEFANQPWRRNQVWLLPTFHELLFHMKVLCKAFLYLQFGFVIFWQKNIGAKAAHKMLVKFTTAVQTSSEPFQLSNSPPCTLTITPVIPGMMIQPGNVFFRLSYWP